MEIGRFLVFNLAASLLAGILAWLLVMAALHLLRLRSAFLHTSFLALPLIKSVLILGGMGLVLPGPVAWFGWVQSQAIAPLAALPWIIAWFGLAASVYTFFAWRARRDILKQALHPNESEARRLNAALGNVINAYQQSPCCEAGEILCCISDQIPADPDLLISEQLLSPLALVEAGRPVLLFPRQLLAELEEAELTLVVAHELNHFALRKPFGQSPGFLRGLILFSPIAFLLADYYHREEEKSCDDLAVAIFKQPEAYAKMLLKSYQFARRQSRSGWLKPLPSLPGLLGAKPLISERVERLLTSRPAQNAWKIQPLLTGTLWLILVYFLFLARFGS
jgi:beta-lactamase regulating signal transducer with metallopeptidase domain